MTFPVLIVGAGPVGMELAAELARYGIDFLIIDKRPSSVTTSNAAGIHARTLECWYKRPWSHLFLEQGLKMRGAALHAKKKTLAYFDFSELKNTPYPMILSIPQNQTEKILDDYLTSIHKPVQRNTTLTKLVSHDDHVVAHVDTPEGSKEIMAAWVVGCDGYHSTVRESANIEFQGEDIEERFLLVDADLTVDYDENSFHVYLSQQGILAFFKMKESTRIIAGVGHDPMFKDVNEPTLEVMTEIIKQRTTLQFKINSIAWQSHFWIHERVAKYYKKGRIFIAGDAAHVHSPAGGQGMNTGIQDAYNLAWKLAYVIKQKAPLSLLDSYELERRPIAKQVVSMTSQMTRLVNLRQPILIYLRNLLMPFMARQQFFRNYMLGQMSELSIAYPKSFLSRGKRINSLSPGDRFPDFFDKDHHQNTFDELSYLKHDLFVFHADATQRNNLMSLQNHYQNSLKTNFLAGSEFTSFTLCLVRPDGYIAYLGDNVEDLKKYLTINFSHR